MIYEGVNLYGEGNIMSMHNCISYSYRVQPINSIYASETQTKELVKKMADLINSINMPGQISILPVRINELRILDNYENLYQQFGHPGLEKLKEDYMEGLKDILRGNPKYRYKIYLTFVDGREELTKKTRLSLFKKSSSDALSKHVQRLSAIVDDNIFKELSNGLNVSKLTKEEMVSFLDYLEMPIEARRDMSYMEPSVDYLKYSYKTGEETSYTEIHSRVLLATQFPKVRHASDGVPVNKILNELNLSTFPIDTFIKFDLIHTKEFKQKMAAQKIVIKKSSKQYRAIDKTDEETQEAFQLAKIGEANKSNDSYNKVAWQMMFRMRAFDLKMLEDRSNYIVNKLDQRNIKLSYQLGDQEDLAINLYPHRKEINTGYQVTDSLYFAQYNFLGGFYLGEEDIGVITNFTKKGKIPILIDLEASAKGRAVTSSTTTAIGGETGSGKSQQGNHMALLEAIFYGRKQLILDPKDDRYPMYRFLQSYGDLANRVVIGSDEMKDGSLDPFIIHGTQNLTNLYSNVLQDVKELARISNSKMEVSIRCIQDAFREYTKSWGQDKSVKPNFTSFMHTYLKIDQKVAEEILALKDTQLGRLFFWDGYSDVDPLYDYDKMFNFITFASVPDFDKEDKLANEKIGRELFSACFSKVVEILNRCLREYKSRIEAHQAKETKQLSVEELHALERPITETIDEYILAKKIPGAKQAFDNNNLIARSLQANLYYIFQNWSDFSDSIKNNLSQVLIGNMKSPLEIAEILEFFQIDETSEVASVIKDRSKVEGLSQNNKYNFFYVDYNNRKGVVKAHWPSILNDAFDTKTKGRDIKESSVEMMGDELYE